jgi:hypothetical protein
MESALQSINITRKIGCFVIRHEEKNNRDLGRWRDARIRRLADEVMRMAGPAGPATK